MDVGPLGRFYRWDAVKRGQSATRTAGNQHFGRTRNSFCLIVTRFPRTLVTGPKFRRSLSRKRRKLSDTRVDEPQIRARLKTTAHFCTVVVLKLRAVPSCAELVHVSIGITRFSDQPSIKNCTDLVELSMQELSEWSVVAHRRCKTVGPLSLTLLGADSGGIPSPRQICVPQ